MQSYPPNQPPMQPPVPGSMQQPAQPGQFQPVQPAPKKKRGRGCLIGGIVAAVVVIAIIIAALNTPISPTTNTAQPTAQPTIAGKQATAAPTTKPTAKPTTAPAVIYPPKTQADLHALAAQGNASAIHEFHSESVGMTGACPQPKRLVTVAPNVTGKQLAADLLAYFYGQHLDNPCGSLILAYHTQSESGDTFTAGRINVDVTDATGQTNFDPNGNGLKYKIELNIGDISGQEYVVSY